MAKSKFVNPATFGRIDPKDWRQVDRHYTADLWLDDLPSRPADYGSNSFPGRTHPEIIKVAAERYTQPGERCWDVFAGSGTVADVCTKVGLRCISTDLHPTREDIRQQDALNWWPAGKVQLAVVHPPYLDTIDYGQGEKTPHDLSQANLDGWRTGMSLVLDNVWYSLDEHRVCVVIVGTVYNKQRVVPLDSELYRLMKPEQWRLLGRVTRTFGETKGGATAGKKAENLWHYRRLRYGIWALSLDTVLFYQKLGGS